MSDPMRIRASMMGDVVNVKVLMGHPMETGLRKDGSGVQVPAHYIKTIKVSCNEKDVLSADWGPAVSKNPFLEFRFKGAKAGDKVIITWSDTAGDSRSDEATIK